MAREQWHMVRLSAETFRQLQELKLHWDHLYEFGRASASLEPSDRYGITMDSVVRELLKREGEHRERSAKKPAKKSTGNSREPESPPSAESDPGRSVYTPPSQDTLRGGLSGL